MISDYKIAALMESLGLDELSAWRHLRDQAILRRQYRYQIPRRYQDDGRR